MSPRKFGNLDDNKIKYKINTEFFNKTTKPQKEVNTIKSEENDVRYKFPTTVKTAKSENKIKSKPKIKVNFWSNKQTVSRLHHTNTSNRSKHRHTIDIVESSRDKAKVHAVKVRKQVSFLPTPVFNDHHVPMVTVPDDLTIQLNEEEANVLGEDLNNIHLENVNKSNKKTNGYFRAKSNSYTSPRSNKRKRSTEDLNLQIDGNDNELEFFSKYVVQKLRKMQTNQRIYSENLINTVLMLGQLGKLSGKSKVTDA